MTRIALVVVGLLLIPIGIYGSIVYPNSKIVEELEAQGYTDVDTSMAFYSSHPFDLRCSGKHPTIRNWTARKANKSHNGDACWSALLGAKIWVDH